MPFATLKLLPGVNTEKTPALNEGGVSISNLIRYKENLIEKMGGWVKYYPTAMSSIVRYLHAWDDLNTIPWLAAGCESSLNAISAGALRDVTPQTLTVNTSVNFTTVAGSNLVVITDSVRDATIYDTVFIKTPVSVGGIVLSGVYPVTIDNGTTSYTITAASNATSSVSNGGAVPVFATTNNSSLVTVTLADHGLSVGDNVEFLILTTVSAIPIYGKYSVFSVTSSSVFKINAQKQANSTVASQSMNSGNVSFLYYIGVTPPPSGTGFGIGGFGSGGFGTGTTPSASPGSSITTTDWSLDNWGEILISSPNDGPIFQWSPNNGYQNSFIISTAPVVNTGFFVAMPQRQIIAYGSTFTGLKDPLLVRWCDIEDFSTWIGTATNAAGSYRIPTGNALIGGMQSPQQGLLWTDIDLWAMQFIDGQLVYGFNKISSGCGLIAKHAATQQAGSTYWMSQKQFFSLTSDGVQQLDCTIWDIAFQDLDLNNVSKIRAGSNSQFNEVMWYIPIAGGTGENSVCIKYNTLLKVWDYSYLSRTAWIDQSVLGSSIGAGINNLIYQHEVGYNDDGQAMNSYFESGYSSLSEGEEFIFIDQMVPDMKWGIYGGNNSASVKITFKTAPYQGSTYTSYGPYTVNSSTNFISLRMRDRLVSTRIESSDLDSFWRIGAIRYRYSQSGRR